MHISKFPHTQASPIHHPIWTIFLADMTIFDFHNFDSVEIESYMTTVHPLTHWTRHIKSKTSANRKWTKISKYAIISLIRNDFVVYWKVMPIILFWWIVCEYCVWCSYVDYAWYCTKFVKRVMIFSFLMKNKNKVRKKPENRLKMAKYSLCKCGNHMTASWIRTEKVLLSFGSAIELDTLSIRWNELAFTLTLTDTLSSRNTRRNGDCNHLALHPTRPAHRCIQTTHIAYRLYSTQWTEGEPGQRSGGNV